MSQRPVTMFSTGGAELPANGNANAPTEVWNEVWFRADGSLTVELWYRHPGQKPMRAQKTAFPTGMLWTTPAPADEPCPYAAYAPGGSMGKHPCVLGLNHAGPHETS